MRFAPLAALVFAAVPAAAQTSLSAYSGATLSLNDAISIALQKNPTYLLAVNARRTNDAAMESARGALLPSVSASFGTNYQQGGQQIFQGVQLAGNSSLGSSYSLGINYSLRASTLLNPAYQRMAQAATEGDIRNAAAQLRSSVTEQYIQVLEDIATAALDDSLRQTAVVQLELARAKVEVGSGIATDVSQAQVAVGQSDVAIVRAQNNIQVDKLRLFALMGVTAPDNDVSLTTAFPLTPPTLTKDSVLAVARSQNPVLAAERVRDAAAVAAVKISKAAYLPSLNVSTGFSGNSFQYTNSDFLVSEARASTASQQAGCVSQDSIRTKIGLTPFDCSQIQFTDAEAAAIRSSNSRFPFKFTHSPWGLSVGLSVPVFNGFGTQVAIQQADISRANSDLGVRAADLQLTTDVTSAYLTMQAAYKTVQLDDQVAASAREQLTTAEERYRVGSATFLEVATARGTFAQAESDRVNAIYEYHKAFAAMEFAVGVPLR